MTNTVQELCIALLHADTEAEVVAILRKEGYWDDPPFGAITVTSRRTGRLSGTSKAAPSRR